MEISVQDCDLVYEWSQIIVDRSDMGYSLVFRQDPTRVFHLLVDFIPVVGESVTVCVVRKDVDTHGNTTVVVRHRCRGAVVFDVRRGGRVTSSGYLNDGGSPSVSDPAGIGIDSRRYSRRGMDLQNRLLAS